MSAIGAAALMTATGAQAADIKIGAAGLLSGGAAQYGISIRNAQQAAVEQINAAGGINGDKLVLVVEDEQGKKEEAINVFKKLIFQDRVLMIFGPTLSNSAERLPDCASGQDSCVRHFDDRRWHHLDR